MTTSMPSSGRLAVAVISCDHAAAAKGFPLERELKTLLLDTSAGTVAASLPAHRRLRLRSVKRLLGCRQARLCSTSQLDRLGLAPGRINPFLPELASVRHLVDRSCFVDDWMSTNDGTLTGYTVFETGVLDHLPRLTIADIASPSGSGSASERTPTGRSGVVRVGRRYS